MTSLAGLAVRGFWLNAVLALIKLVAGVVGSSYALIADAVESMADLFASMIVWSGLRISRRDADERFPFGYGKAESLATVAVGVLLVGASIGIAIEAIREIVTPHHAPAPFTLLVLIGVVIVKFGWARLVARRARAEGNALAAADAGHHRADAITSAAAFVGITVALIGGPGWEGADDVAALGASILIFLNGVAIIRPAAEQLMDRSPEPELFDQVERVARQVPEVLATEKLRIRRMGPDLHVEMHVQSDATLSLHAAHVVSGKVKRAILGAVPGVRDVLIHMEPFGE